MGNNFEELDPDFKTKVIVLQGAVNKDERVVRNGYQFRPGEGRRVLPTQMAYYSRGRMAPASVQAMYKAAGLYAIPLAECSQQITKTLDSMHLKGLAQDFVPQKKVGDKWADDWKAPREVWEALGELAESLGLEWGGSWGRTVSVLGWDTPHVQSKGV